MSSQLPRLFLVSLLALGGAAAPVQGQDAAPQGGDGAIVDESLSSPAATMRTFMAAMSGDPPDRERGAECLDLSGVTRVAGPDLALWLHKSMIRIAPFDPDDRTVPDDLSLREARNRDLATWTLFPAKETSSWDRSVRRRIDLVRRRAPDARIVLTRQASGSWLFSAETVAGIEPLWDQLRELDPVDTSAGDEYRTTAERLESLWPPALIENRVLGLKYWQWIVLLALIFIGLALDFTVRAILATIVRRVIERRGGSARRETVRRMVRPFGLTAAAMVWLASISVLGLPSGTLAVLVPAVRLFAMLAFVWAAYRVTDLGGEVLSGKAELTETRIDDLLIPLVRKTIKVFITAIGLIYIADSFDVEILPLLTGLGIGTLAFGLAAKDSIENFFGSVAVIVDRPFEVGDWVQIGDVEGTVEELGFRSTRVRTFYNSLVTVPNATLVRAVVDNYGRRRYRRYRTHLNIAYDTPPDRIEAFCEGVRELIRLHPYARKDYYQVWFHEYGPHSLDVLLYMFHEAPDWQTELRERHRLNLDILRLADRLGVEFAFPTQTLHVHQAEGDEARTPAAPPGERSEQQAFQVGRRAVEAITAEAEWRRGKPEPYRFEFSSVPRDADDDGETQIESKVGGDA